MPGGWFTWRSRWGLFMRGEPLASFACAADRIAVPAGTESEGLHAGEGDLRLCVGRDGELIRHRAVGIVAPPRAFNAPVRRIIVTGGVVQHSGRRGLLTQLKTGKSGIFLHRLDAERQRQQIGGLRATQPGEPPQQQNKRKAECRTLQSRHSAAFVTRQSQYRFYGLFNLAFFLGETQIVT